MSIILDDFFLNPQLLAFNPPPFIRPPPPPREVIKPYWFVERSNRPLASDTCPFLATKAAELSTYLQYHILELSVNRPMGDVLNPKSQAGVRQDTPSKMDGMPTGTFLRSTGSVITTPYQPTSRCFVNNGVQDHPDNVDEKNLIYFWVADDKSKVRPTVDGTVSITPPSRRDDTPLKVNMFVPGCELYSKGFFPGDTFTNDEVNAFTLVLGIDPGPEYVTGNTATARNNKTSWKVTITFGEVSLELEEGRPESRITVAGRSHMLTVNPGAASKTRTDAGPRSYELTFIPVWNGLVVSDSTPSSPNWGSKTTYIRKDTRFSMYKEFDSTFNANASNTPPRYGVNGSLLPVGPLTNLGDFPKCCFLPTDPVKRVKFGSNLVVTFQSCGGTLRFVPVFFTNIFRTYLFMKGQSPPPNINVTPCPNWVSVPNTYPVPIVQYQGMDTATYTPGFWINPGGNPSNVLALEIYRDNAYYRRPAECWGLATAYIDSGPPTPLSGEGDVQSLQFRTDEGALTLEDLPVDRVRRFSVERGLDGMSGSLEWDRYDPLLGLVRRPNQDVGAVLLQMIGGVNTRPGTVYTGIVMGNAETDTHDSNTVILTLHGRECKMTDSEGGLRIVNAPFFDGFDHRNVLSWMANYAGIPFVTFARPYKLPTGTIMSPVVDITTGTPVWDAMQMICKLSSTIIFFDRFGVLRQYDVGQTSGVNWFYPQHKIENYNDQPDLSQMRDTIVVAGLVAVGEIDVTKILTKDQKGFNADPQLMMVALQQLTDPFFPWSKMLFYAIPGVIQPSDLMFAANKIALGVARPRAVGSVTIPGNADVELLDTFNLAWAITKISHGVDLQTKVWNTTLSLEFIQGAIPQDQGDQGSGPTGGQP